MERVVRIFRSFEEAERVEREYYASLTPQQRVNLLQEMRAQYLESLGEAGRGFENVCRITKLPDGDEQPPEKETG